MIKIYYLSGRGGSLRVAQGLASVLGAPPPVPMTGKRRVPRPAFTPADVVGFVFPAIDFGVPVSVRQFIASIPRGARPAYAFAVALNGGMPCATLPQCRNLLRSRGIALDAGFSIERKKDESAGALPARIESIAAAVGSRSRIMERPGSLTDRVVLTGIVNPLARFFVGAEDKKFRVSDACSHCGICARVCPAGNITLKGGTPTWLHRCDQCGACVNWCPNAAISGTCLAARARRPEPGVTAADMIIDKGEMK
jgi:ferredoxin